MSYMDINNLYKDRSILLFKQIYVMEKIHGTSAHVRWKDWKVSFFPGGSDYPSFSGLFDSKNLEEVFLRMFGDQVVVVYGEAYGGRMQGMKDTYGDKLKFIAFEVKVNESWLDVPNSEKVVLELGLEFVDYKLVDADIDVLNAERDKPSVQAIRNGMGDNKKREGIVLRPLIELRRNNGDRIIAKHKAEDFRETRTPRPLDAEKLEILSKAEDIANEWATEMRLNHVLDQFPEAKIEDLGNIIKAMIADIEKEAGGEVENFKEARKSIGKKTAQMFKRRVNQLNKEE